MAPSEEGILRSFLLQKAALRDVLTLAEFSTFFPLSKRASPLVRSLYTDLQSQRNAICESVLKQLHLECRFGDNLIAQTRARRQSHRGDGKAASMENLDSQPFGGAGPESAVEVQVIVSEMDSAVIKLREDMDQVQQQINIVSGQLQRLCGDMSDLKYGSADNRITQELRGVVEVADRLVQQ